MDFLHLDPIFHVLICTRCQYALMQGTIAAHLRSLHKEDVSKAEVTSCVAFWKEQPLKPAKEVQQLELSPNTPLVPNLALFHDGISCRLCTKRLFVCSRKATSTLQRHLKKVHGWVSGDKGGRPPNASVAQERGFAAVTTAPVSYQTFHWSNFLRLFQVEISSPLETPNSFPEETTSKADHQSPPATLEAQVERQLEQKLQVVSAASNSVLQPTSDPSAWLQPRNGSDICKAMTSKQQLS
jgi:Orsellinic acid/F9775 biosynthesis cluster protein D